MKKCGLLSCRRFSYLPPFNHDIITQNTTNSNIYLYIYAHTKHKYAHTYLQKNIKMPLIFQFGLYINILMSKYPIVFKDVIFYLH